MKKLFARWFGRRTQVPSSPRPAPPQVDPAVEQFLFRLPKVELGVGLERCLRPAQFLSLAKKYNLGLVDESEAEARRLLHFRDRSSFEEVEGLIRRGLRDPEDLHVLTLDLLAEQAIQNIRYSEVHVHLATHLARGMDGETLRQALAEAAQDGERRHGVAIRFLVSLRPEEGQGALEQALEWIASRADGLVLGLHVACLEATSTGSFLSSLENVDCSGLRRTAYAASPEVVETLLQGFAPERLTLAAPATTPELLEELGSRKLGAILQPVEDLRLGLCRDLPAHPIAQVLGDASISLTTGGAPLFGTNLTREYVNLHRFLGSSQDSLVKLAQQGVRQSFWEEEKKRALEEELSTL